VSVLIARRCIGAAATTPFDRARRGTGRKLTTLALRTFRNRAVAVSSDRPCLVSIFLSLSVER